LARIPEEVIRSVQESVDIVEIVGKYVTLKRSGSSFRGLCPFHEEKTASFHVFPASGRYKCFGCGEGGNVFTFLMRRSNLGFREVLEELAAEEGIELPAQAEGPGEAEQRGRRLAALDAVRYAAGFFRAVFLRPAGEAARAYLEQRGFRAETLDAFEIGFAPDALRGLLDSARKHAISESALFDAGLVRRNERGQLYDMFRGRIIFPIQDLKGRVVGFGARAMGDAQPKYLNSPDSILFHKGREMYGLHAARDAARGARRLLVVEGYTDVMACHQAGLREVAAGLGTALTPENARQLRRFRERVILLYDGDEAGRRAAERASEILLAEQVDGAVALLPPGKDPADLLAREGLEAIEQVVEQARDLWGFRLERALERHDLKTLEGREKAIAELKEPIARMVDPIRRDLAFRLLAERVGVDEATLRRQIPTARAGRAPAADPPRAGGWVRAEGDFILAALGDATVWERVERAHPPDRFVDPALGRVAGAIHDLRTRGESVTREALLGALEDNDEAIRALQALDAEDGAFARAMRHLVRIEDGKRVEEALRSGKDPLEAVIEARRAKRAAGADDDGAR